MRRELPIGAGVTPFAFAKREENSIATRGIENNHDEEILEPYSTTTRSHNGTVVARAFPNNRKTEFANHILQHGTDEYFTNFQDLHRIVSEILGTAPPSSLPNSAEEAVGHSNGEKPYLPPNLPYEGEFAAVLK